MASKNPNNYNGAPPKYINDFSKALAGEVRILLAEVGKLRDERRQLQFEIAELMALKSKHGAGGEYSPDWRPKIEDAPPSDAVVLAAPDPGMPAPARPAWRTINKRERKARTMGKLTAPPPASTPAPAPVAAAAAQPDFANPGLPAWASWRPNPLLSPMPIAGTSAAPLPTSPPPRPGLFGPSTPPPK